MPASEETGSGPVVHDHRRIDPVTGKVRGKHAASKPAGTRGAGRPGPGSPGREAGSGSGPGEAQLAERTADLQRLQAEYANYRRRVDRDRAAVREQAVVGTLAGLIPVLDAIDKAREHGELSGGFEKVAESLQAALSKLGLVAYGEKGDPFDPNIHEALTGFPSPEVTEDTCVEILFPGYKVGDRILRPAKVAVAKPATGPDGISDEAGWPAGEEGN